MTPTAKWIMIIPLLIFALLRVEHPIASVSAGEPIRLGPDEIPISVIPGTEEEDPVVASDGKNYMVVWQSNRKSPENYDVYVTRMSPEGKVLDPQGIPVSTAPSNQIFTDIARGNGQYLVVWQDLRSSQRWEIYGARLRFDGKVLDPQGIPIATGKGNARHPQVAWDRKNFFVVWTEENPGRGWDVAGARISPTGKVLDPNRIPIAQAAGDQTTPALAWGKDRYLVVWMESGGVSGALVDSSGKVINPNGIVLSRPAREAGYPAVAWGQDRYVVVWAEKPTPSVHVLGGIRVGSSGSVDDSDRFVVEESPNFQTFPSVNCSGDACLIVWEKDQSQGRPMKGIEDVIRDVKGAWIDLSQKTITPKEVMIAAKAIGNHFAKVTSNGRNYLVAWKDYRTGTANSLGRLLTYPR
jgi:hypothetical protein